MVPVQCPLWATCSVCAVPGSDSSGHSASAPAEALPARGTRTAGSPGHSREMQGADSAGFGFLCWKEKTLCPFCPLIIVLDHAVYFKIKLNLLYFLEMHFKSVFNEDSCTLGIQKRRECCIQTAEKRFFWSMSNSPYYWLAWYFKAKTLLFAACYLIYRDLILCNVLYIYTSVINCTLDKRMSSGLTAAGAAVGLGWDWRCSCWAGGSCSAGQGLLLSHARGCCVHLSVVVTHGLCSACSVCSRMC